MAIIPTKRKAANAIVEALGMTRESTTDMAIKLEEGMIIHERCHGSQEYVVCKFTFTPPSDGVRARVVVSELHTNLNRDTYDMLEINLQTALGMDFDVAVE